MRHVLPVAAQKPRVALTDVDVVDYRPSIGTVTVGLLSDMR